MKFQWLLRNLLRNFSELLSRGKPTEGSWGILEHLLRTYWRDQDGSGYWWFTWSPLRYRIDYVKSNVLDENWRDFEDILETFGTFLDYFDVVESFCLYFSYASSNLFLFMLMIFSIFNSICILFIFKISASLNIARHCFSFFKLNHCTQILTHNIHHQRQVFCFQEYYFSSWILSWIHDLVENLVYFLYLDVEHISVNGRTKSKSKV